VSFRTPAHPSPSPLSHLTSHSAREGVHAGGEGVLGAVTVKGDVHVWVGGWVVGCGWVGGWVVVGVGGLRHAKGRAAGPGHSSGRVGPGRTSESAKRTTALVRRCRGRGGGIAASGAGGTGARAAPLGGRGATARGKAAAAAAAPAAVSVAGSGKVAAAAMMRCWRVRRRRTASAASASAVPSRLARASAARRKSRKPRPGGAGRAPAGADDAGGRRGRGAAAPGRAERRIAGRNSTKACGERTEIVQQQSLCDGS
jgi:hypothetical protein